MGLKKGQRLEVEIEKIAFGGRGLVKVNGFALFVDQAVPGDVALVRITKKKKSYGEARVEELIQPSDLRIEAPCPYSGHCGGCKWQFLGYDQQIIFKRQHVAESLEHIGRIPDAMVHATIPSDRAFEYRNKMEFTCAERRWLLPQEMETNDPKQAGLGIGLHVPGTFYKVLDTKACLLQPDLGNHILDDIRQYIKQSKAPVYSLRSHEGYWRFVTLRHSVAYDNWMVNLVTAGDDPDEMEKVTGLLRDKYPQIVSVVNNITARKAGIAVGEKEIHLAGKPYLKERIGEFEFKISANSFFQTHTAGAERLYAVVKQYANVKDDETVMDLYCGTGTIGIYLSSSAREVVGIEQVQSAIEDAKNNCQANGIDNCRFIQGDMRDGLKETSMTPDVMIIDPPRAGMHKDVVRRVLEMAPGKIVYVSCNPAALARDIALMADAYHLVEVQPVDLFPHTYHIESVSLLIKKG